MSRASRAKGIRGELELAKLFREHGFEDCRRGVQYRGTPDSPDVIGLPGCHVESKRSENVRLYEWLERLVDDTPRGTTPVLFHRRSRGPWVAVLPADEFLKILHDAEHGRAPEPPREAVAWCRALTPGGR